MAKPVYDYWEIKAHIHAAGEALARAQQASHLATATAAQFRQADGELKKLWERTGFTGKPSEYTFDDATKTIVPVKEETPPETTTP